MKIIKSAVAGAVLAATAAGGLLLGASPAFAAAPTWEPDVNGNGGSISFYNAAGQQVTSGTNLAHLFDYAVASTAEDPAGFHKASISFAFPNHLQPTSSWFVNGQSTSTTYPNSSAPAPVSGFANPVATISASEGNLTAALGGGVLDNTAGYANIMQIRLTQSGGFSGAYWTADIQFNTATNTWTQVFPQFATTSISTITASPTSPAPAGTTSVSLSATLSSSDNSHPTGSVHLFNGNTDLGAATFTPATGAISASAAVVDNGSYNFKFVYTPDVSIIGSTSPVLAYSVKGPAQATTTVLSGPTSTTVGTAVTIHADVTAGSPASAVPASAGSVQFKVGGSNVGSPVALTGSGADFQYNPGAAGSATITGTFIPADPAVYVTSSDNTGVTVTASAPLFNPDPQNFDVSVPAGTLIISTPYTVENPFHLGTMKLSSDGTGLSASAPFGDPAAPAAIDPGPGSLGHTPIVGAYPAAATANGITITDTRAGSTGWTASAQTTDFTNSGSTPIDGNLLTFTGVTAKYLSGNALQAGSVNVHDIAAFKTAKKAFADTTHGPGTVNIVGTMNLTAPTSTLPGLYTATVTFTIV